MFRSASLWFPFNKIYERKLPVQQKVEVIFVFSSPSDFNRVENWQPRQWRKHDPETELNWIRQCVQVGMKTTDLRFYHFIYMSCGFFICIAFFPSFNKVKLIVFFLFILTWNLRAKKKHLQQIHVKNLHCANQMCIRMHSCIVTMQVDEGKRQISHLKSLTANESVLSALSER